MKDHMKKIWGKVKTRKEPQVEIRVWFLIFFIHFFLFTSLFILFASNIGLALYVCMLGSCPIKHFHYDLRFMSNQSLVHCLVLHLFFELWLTENWQCSTHSALSAILFADYMILDRYGGLFGASSGSTCCIYVLTLWWPGVNADLWFECSFVIWL